MKNPITNKEIVKNALELIMKISNIYAAKCGKEAATIEEIDNALKHWEILKKDIFSNNLNGILKKIQLFADESPSVTEEDISSFLK